MALDVNGYNASFSAFVKFAQDNIATNNKAVARFCEGGAQGLEARTIVAADPKSDKVAKFKRSVEQQNLNNAVRTEFRNAVIDMFGGESRIPESVKKAMLLADYDKGKPLTARRIMAVKAAIDNVKAADAKPVNMTASVAKKMASAAADALGFELSREQMDTVQDCLQRFGNQMTGKNARTYANFLVSCLVNGMLFEDVPEGVANDMKNWRDFDFGDNRLEKLGKKFVERNNNYIRQNMSNPKLFLPENPDIFGSLYGDANRASWNINGKEFAIGTSADKVVDEFCKAVKNPNARKAISTLLNQSSLADIQSLMIKGEALVGDPNAKEMQTETLYTIENGDMFVSRDMARDGYQITGDAELHFELQVSEDGKTATVTVTTDKNLTSTGDKNAVAARFGKASVSQRITVDLTKEMPTVTNVTFAQSFTPDVVDRGKNAE